jgi:N4-gp56 family major capsid protein
MSANTTTTLSDQYQAYLNKQLLDYAVQELRLNEFAQPADLPKNVGGKTVTFFRFDEPSSSNVQTLTEGTTPTTTRDLTLTTVTATLAQYGELIELTDILSATELFDSLKQGVRVMGQDAALQADDLSREELVDNGTKVYAQGNSTFADLIADPVAAAKIVATDVLDIVTLLKVKRAPKIGGSYVGVIAPQVSRDVQDDDDWKEASKYGAVKQLFKGELGELYGCRFVEATNPHRDDSAGTEGTHSSTGDIYSTIFLGANAFGAVKLAGDRPMSPKVMVVRGPDKYDPLDQTTKAGWKAFYCSKILNSNWFRVYKSKSSFSLT